MTIRYTTNLTFEEQLTHWANGNSEEVALEKRLREGERDRMKDAVDQAHSDGYEEGFADGQEFDA